MATIAGTVNSTSPVDNAMTQSILEDDLNEQEEIQQNASDKWEVSAACMQSCDAASS